MQISPLHFLPRRLHAVVYLVFGTAWALLCVYGTIRFVFEREWGYAVATLLGVLIMIPGLVNAILVLRSSGSEDPADEMRQRGNIGPPPIE